MSRTKTAFKYLLAIFMVGAGATRLASSSNCGVGLQIAQCD